jgi:hypothetical protein
MIETVFSALKQYWIPVAVMAAFFIVFFGITEYARRAEKKKKEPLPWEEKRNEHSRSA